MYGHPLPDQAAYNVLLRQEPWANITRTAATEDGWAAQLVWVARNDPEKLPVLTEPPPVVGRNNIVRTAGGRKFAVVHQYTRIPELKDAVYAQWVNWEPAML